ncbi:DUF732 domain-containing protein [Mycobacterium sp. Aquia_216]|uniref:DUF732 domain-containing protein n=1 Tax=Mycobacterium sp. Aquia_216 TaxID=2991729 RepID=UPI00227B468C|nr:DUF732 domain-containing protein [Mycobacterium sp. Aquia_216]WAJ47080.1 DUF732 domain-containing protein [Mycobacterium sp. Aquia_216]
MRRLLMLVSAVAMVGLAAPANADGMDDQFLAALQASGVTFPDPARAIAAGKWVCQAVGQGTQMVDVVKTVEDRNPGLREDNAAKFAAIAATAYCPSALPRTTGSNGPQ